jgi:hypothetical protein
MRLLCKLRNQYLLQGFLANSLPKAGTNLLAKVLSLFPGVRTDHAQVLHLDPDNIDRFRKPGDGDGPSLPLGVTWPRQVPVRACRRALKQLQRGQFLSAHAPYSPELARLLTELKVKSVLILRDPRDVVVSTAQYVPRTPYNVFHDLYRSLSEFDRLMITIRGRRPTSPGEPLVRGIQEACRSLLPWMKQPFNYTTYFHRLVGPQGGGTHEDQVAELENLARHVGLRYRFKDLEQIARETYGGTHTFRKGTSGDWRSHFTPEHKEAFKEVAGALLIEMGYEKDLSW